MKKAMFLLLLFASLLPAGVEFQSGRLTIENKKFVKVFTLDKTSGPIALTSLYSKTTQKELLARAAVPCFKFAFVFSGVALAAHYSVTVNPEKFLAVLNSTYQLNENSLDTPLVFTMPDATREAFIIPNNGKNVSIISSTCWLDEVKIEDDGALVYETGAAGKQVIKWKSGTRPSIMSKDEINTDVSRAGGDNVITVLTQGPAEIEFPQMIDLLAF